VSRRSVPFAGTAAAVLGITALVGACGKKGPPLAPLRPVPGPVAELAARRAGNEVRFTFTVPAQNVDATRPPSLERIEVYAVTVAADAPVPPNRDLLTPKYLVGTIPIRPVEEENGQTADSVAKPGAVAPAPEKKEDPRPAPGDTAAFVEELNEARMKPQVVPGPVTTGTAPATTAAVAAAWAATVAQVREAPVTSRVYVLRGVSTHGRPGQPSERVSVPVLEVPPPPTGVTASAAESKVTLSWSAPAATDPLAALGTAPVYNVYPSTGASPLNPSPLQATSFDRAGVEFGKEECFVVRTAVTRGNLTIESPASPPACVTAADTFPPSAPKGLSAVANVGAISLIWDANTESDLAGYIVLRGEVPGDKLQAITATPIRETTFADKTAVPGTRYVYAVVAVDRATPANTSPQSARVEETAR
jgi:hypothetical protein